MGGSKNSTVADWSRYLLSGLVAALLAWGVTTTRISILETEYLASERDRAADRVVLDRLSMQLETLTIEIRAQQAAIQVEREQRLREAASPRR